MTESDKQYQEKVEAAAKDDCKFMQNDVYHMYSEEQIWMRGVAWANANPSPKVQRLIEALTKIKGGE